VGLLLVSSMSIFGIYGHHRANSTMAGIEPVYVNGVMGVYNPYTNIFVPSTSPDFDETCELIQEQRGYTYTGGSYGHHWSYYPSLHSFTSTGSYAHSSYSSGSFSSSSSSSHTGSIRGGIGSTGHSMGASHS
jgi:hypothetical protein